MYGLGDFQPAGYAFFASSSETAGTMITSCPCFQFTGVAKEGRPILRGRRDAPIASEDSGWQFRGHVASSEDIEKAQIWSVREVLKTDPSLQAIIEHWTIASPDDSER